MMVRTPPPLLWVLQFRVYLLRKELRLRYEIETFMWPFRSGLSSSDIRWLLYWTRRLWREFTIRRLTPRSWHYPSLRVAAEPWLLEMAKRGPGMFDAYYWPSERFRHLTLSMADEHLYQSFQLREDFFRNFHWPRKYREMLGQ